MKVKGTQTTVQTVDVELGDAEVLRVADSLDPHALSIILRNKLMNKFIVKLAGDRKGDLFIAERYWSKHHRNVPESGEGNYLTLIERDADFDYHNNVGVDENIRVLTKDEVKMYKTIAKLPDNVLTWIVGLKK
ncbi:hypothetical protein [Staphylococcus haemolyticus]|uniref:hypothetical protein n=1 Tax=Staphylococcus haemolyticus TaxID=1283 RepID=UPI001E599A17|nr:hypothetical protein [Staphylococcus haemolyticus]MCC3722102.1 hypothetical protein [Staphylococcus haemolyticus]